MAAIEMNEAELVVLAMKLDGQLGNGILPLHEMQIIAFYHPEEETRRLVGKAIVRCILKSDAPDDRKAAILSGISKECKCHIEAREDAGKALCEIIRKAGTWEKAYSIAMDSNYPPEIRTMAASDFLDNSDGKAGIATVLGCIDISEKVREVKGLSIVGEALDRGNWALVDRIVAEKGIPPILAIYIKSRTRSGAGNPRFGKGRISEPPPEDMTQALERLPTKR